MSEIQSRVAHERLFSHTKHSILLPQSRTASLSQEQAMDLLQEIIAFNTARQRPLPSTLAYIMENRGELSTVPQPTLDTVMEAYAQDLYLRYSIAKSYEENLRNKKHEEVMTSIPPEIIIPEPRPSKTYQSIVVDLSDQRMYIFEENILIASSLITSGKR